MRPAPMHALPRCLAVATALFVLSGCATPVATRGDAPAAVRTAPAIDAFFVEFTDAWMRRNPNAATASGYFQGAEQDALDRQITPQTAAHDDETLALARQGLARLAAFDARAMDDTTRVSAQLMRWQLQAIVDGAPSRDLQFPLQQMSGTNVGLPNLMTVIHPVRNARDAENYIARLRLFDARMGEAVAESRAQAARGVLPPRFILDATIAQMRTFITPAPAANPLVSTLASKLEGVDTVDATRRKAFTDEAAGIVEAGVYPAWRAAIAELESQRGRATDDAGLWRFADGAAAYRQRLRQFTSTDLTADEIHAIGLREVARIEGEMDTILRSIGRTSGSVKDRADQLEKDLAYPDTVAGRAQIMADIETMIRDAETRADTVFDIRPKSTVIARPYPEFRWAAAAASYTAPPLDLSRPGLFQMPLRPDRLTRFGLRTLTYHETVPGHHFQVALSVENTDVPKFRQVRAFGGISAFSEGWALYAERIAAEQGWYDGDPQGRLGQLDAELFRARRLVVDTGLHAKRWTRQQAIDYGIPPSEVDRYVVNPGQATSYKIGQLEILRLRDMARTTLGPRYDARQFHNLLLRTGTVPLTLLEAEVTRWVRAQG